MKRKFITQYTICCTQEQTKKAFELGAPLFLLDKMQSEGFDENPYKEDYKDRTKLSIGLYAFCPTAEEMIGWLEDQGVVEVFIEKVGKDWAFDLYNNKGQNITNSIESFPSRREATLAAIDVALEYLANNLIK